MLVPAPGEREKALWRTKGVRWSDNYRMRPLGGVTVVEQEKASPVKR
jgi:hypothetical protein